MVTLLALMLEYLGSVLVTVWVTVAVSSSEPESWAALTVTVCAVLQFVVVKTRLAGSAVTSVLSAGSLTVTVALAVGWEASTTV